MILIRTILVLRKNGIQSPQNSDYDLNRELRSHIQTLQSEVHFLREELKEKSVLLRSLIITSNNQKQKKKNSLKKKISLKKTVAESSTD